MGNGDCLTEDELGAFAVGALPSETVGRLAGHIESCPRCQGRLERVGSGTQDGVLSAIRQVRTVADGGATDGAATDGAAMVRPPPVLEEGSLSLNPRVSGGATSRVREEVRALLRRRLRVVAWVSVVSWGWFLLMQARGLNDSVTAQTQRIGAPIMVIGVVVAAASLVVLRRGRDLSMRRLRGIELGLLGVMVTYAACYRYAALSAVPAGGVGADYLRLRVEHATLLSNLYVLLGIISYGVYIPNTGRRCVAVVAAMSVVPLAINAYVGAHHSGVRTQLPMVMAVTTIGLLLSGSIAVFGSFRINVLQREAVEARQLGQYRLTRRIGAGGMGEVYLAEHRLLKRPCAVKVIRAERAGDPAVLKRFEREVQATARLTHPNTVEIYDYGHADDGTFYYVMEYLDGPTLDEVVRREGPLSPPRVVHLLRQVCGALREAHAAGLVHRDVKPGNVIVCTLGGVADRVKLVDFGLVREAVPVGATALTAVDLAMGTPDYMAPEQATSAGRVDGRSDIYGVGALAYFMLTGRPPFTGDGAIAVLIAHARERVRPPSELRADVPEGLERVILRCLAKRPEDRFSDVGELEHALAAA